MYSFFSRQNTKDNHLSTTDLYHIPDLIVKLYIFIAVMFLTTDKMVPIPGRAT